MVGNLPWAPGKYWSLPILFRLYRNRQGQTTGMKSSAKVLKQAPHRGQGKAAQGLMKSAVQKDPSPPHRTKPELAVELITLLTAWLSDREFLLTGDSAYGGTMLTTLRRGSLTKQIRRVLQHTRVDETQLTQVVELLTLAG